VIRGYDRPHQPGNLWQTPRNHIGQEVDGKLGSECILIQQRCRILKSLEVGEDIVRENPAENSLVRRRVNLPRNPPCLKLLRHGRICQTAVNGCAVCDNGLQNWSTVFSLWVEGGCHRVQTIRVGWAHHRAKIVVTDREGIGQGIVIRKVCASVVAHAQCGVVGINGKSRGHKPVHCAVVPALMLRYPVVGDVVRAGCIRCGGV